MKTYVVTSAQVQLGMASGNGRRKATIDAAIRAFSEVAAPKTGKVVDTSPERVARQFRDQVRKVIRAANDAGILPDDHRDHALHLLKLAKVSAVANVVEATGAFTFPIPGFGAVVMEGEVGAVGKLATAGDRTERRIAQAVQVMREGALEQAREEVKLIAA